MILTVGRACTSIEGVAIIENILIDESFGAENETELSIENLWKIKQCPHHYKSNLCMSSIRDSSNEISKIKNCQNSLVIDATTISQNRNPNGLCEISERTGCHIVMSASLPNDLPSDPVLYLVDQLMFGIEISNDQPKIKCGVISLNYSDNVKGWDVQLAAAAEAQKKCFELCGGKPPILLNFNKIPKLFEVATKSLDKLKKAFEESPKHTIISGLDARVSTEECCDLLGKGAFLCFNTFGTSLCNEIQAKVPLDWENAGRVVSLVEKFGKRVLISHGIRQKIHLTLGGGCGYSHIQSSVLDICKELGLGPEKIDLLCKSNIFHLLDWFVPTSPNIPNKEFVDCSWCKGKFEPIEGTYFSKFSFVYCSTTCLRSHREAGFV